MVAGEKSCASRLYSCHSTHVNKELYSQPCAAMLAKDLNTTLQPPRDCCTHQPVPTNRHSMGRKWEVNLTPEKTQVMLVSQRHRPFLTPIPIILIGGKALPLQAFIFTLGVKMNSALIVTGHVNTIARVAAWKLSFVQRVSHLHLHLICNSSPFPHGVCISHLFALPHLHT